MNRWRQASSGPERKPINRRKVLMLAGSSVFAGGLGLQFWPGREELAAYPFARPFAGTEHSLWRIDAKQLEVATEDDARRLLRFTSQLEKAVLRVETSQVLLSGAKVGELSASERKTIRELWWQVFEPIVAIDSIKQRYRGWYGIDYFKHEKLHARAFTLGFVGLCAQVEAGIRLLKIVAGKSIVHRFFDEAMPEFGLPPRTFTGLRGRLGRAKDLLLIPLGAGWYDKWIAKHLAGDAKVEELNTYLAQASKRAIKQVWTPTTSGVENKFDTLKAQLFSAWFPLQKGVAEWAGDTRFASPKRRLISDQQLHELRRKLQPCDILIERRNWYLSNIGLPGFWPHAALYVGTQREIVEQLAQDKAVSDTFGNFAEHLAREYPKAWASLAAHDDAGHEQCVVEAVSEGVVSASIEHSCGADYVAALRPRISPLERAHAIKRALSFWGRPYDFNFDFATDAELVCSELVLKALEAEQGKSRFTVPYIEVAGRKAVPPTEFVRVFAEQLSQSERQFDFVYFLDGREKEHTAVVADADALAKTPVRPKWDIVQP